jgi:TrwC relaxase
VTPLRVGREAYWLDQIAHDRCEYCSGKGESPGWWTGSLVEQAGLTGVAEDEAVHRLFAGQDPLTDEQRVAEDPQTPTAVAAPSRTRGAALAAHPPSSQPTASQTAGPGDRADGDGSTSRQRTEPADRPNNGQGNAAKAAKTRPVTASPARGEHGKNK